jgi:flagellar assembly factor FliW
VPLQSRGAAGTELAERPSAAEAPTPAGETAEGLPVLQFVRSMPGFPGLTRFALVRLGGEESSGGATAGGASDPTDAVLEALVYEMRSLDDPDVRFLVAVPTAFFPDYVIDLDETTCEELDLHDAADALVLVVLTVDAEDSSPSANLLAPVVINGRNRSAAQAILSGSEWPVRAALA